VAEDLFSLAAASESQPDDVWLRRASAILRRLLVDDELGRAWRQAGFGGEPLILAPFHEITMAPGARLLYAGSFDSPREGRAPTVLVAAGKEPGNSRLTSTIEALPLSAFMRGACMNVLGTAISRRDLVKYVANKLGGAHFDQARHPTRDAAYLQLDAALSVFMIQDRSSVFFELLTLVRTLVASPDIQRFLGASTVRS